MTVREPVHPPHVGGMEGDACSADLEPWVLERSRRPRQYLARCKAEVLAECARWPTAEGYLSDLSGSKAVVVRLGVRSI